jgi:hypothetical protein
MKERYVLEGEWSGYRSSQKRVVHRVIITDPEKYKDLSSILYTDGTCLKLTVRKCLPRERVKEIRSYSRLIEGCVFYGVNSVKELYDKENGGL